MLSSRLPPVWRAARLLPAAAASIVCATSIMVALNAETRHLFPVLLGCAIVFGFLFRNVLHVHDASPLTWLECGVFCYAVSIGVIHAAPYAVQCGGGGLVSAVVWDDNWHFQELASLVNSPTYPPRLNFQPDAYLHFYYVSLIPAALIAQFLDAVVGPNCLKLAYGLGSILTNAASVIILFLFLRHLLAPRARAAALVLVFLIGALPDGVFAGWHLAVRGALRHSEWWPARLDLNTQISSWTSLLIWVPHHLIAAMTFLLAVVTVTNARTLSIRAAPLSAVAAGLTLSFSLYSSVFSFLGGVVAFLPLGLLFVRRWNVALIVASAAVLSGCFLSYIYLNSHAANGFVLFRAFHVLQDRFGGAAAGLAGLFALAAAIILEIGWLAALAVYMSQRRRECSFPLCHLGVASTLYIASLLVVSFQGANNYAMRGSIIPALLIVAWLASVLQGARPSHSGTPSPRLPLGALLYPALAIAGVAHVNELTLLSKSAYDSYSFATESTPCKEEILAINRERTPPARLLALSHCTDSMSSYSVERPFFKDTLEPPDQELKGDGPLKHFWLRR